MAGKTLALRLVVAICLMVSVAAPTAASAGVTTAAVPTTVIVLDPDTPDGLGGWYLSAPDVYLTSDSTGTVYWDWGFGESSAPVLPGVPVLAGYPPDGLQVISAYTVSSEGETEAPPVQAVTQVDSDPPPQPQSLEGTVVVGSVVSLNWAETVDAVSGTTGYSVFRNLVGPPFSGADLISSTTLPTFTDVSTPLAGSVFYAVQAHDAAGHASPVSDAIEVVLDAVPPSQPSSVQAWLNALNWARVSWDSSVDTGTGVASYVISRSIDSGPYSEIATVPAAALYFDDTDPSVPTAGTVHYSVTALDYAGRESLPGGPDLMGVDLTPPATPLAPVAVPLYSGLPTLASFSVAWAAPADVGSGLFSMELAYGAVPSSPDHTVRTTLTAWQVTAGNPTALLYFSVRAEDRAGNSSLRSAETPARNVTTYRIAGQNRIETALKASQATFNDAETVVFASATRFPDALCAASLAGALEAPILLVGPGPLSADTIAELQRLGTLHAFVIGGPSAVEPATYASIDAALTGTVERVAGTNRYATAVAVAAKAAGFSGNPVRVFLVSGETFPDALSLSPASYAAHSPILFATRSSVPLATSQALAGFSPAELVIAGGTSAVTPQAESLPVASILRLAGANRYATSQAIAAWADGQGILPITGVAVATGLDFPDGLSGGSLAGHDGIPLVLTSDAYAAETAEWLKTYRSQLDSVRVLGGTRALSATTQQLLWTKVSTP